MYILLWLCQLETMRYSKIKRALGNVTHKVLSNKLKELESEGLHLRREDPQVSQKVEYSLSEKDPSLMSERFCYK